MANETPATNGLYSNFPSHENASVTSSGTLPTSATLGTSTSTPATKPDALEIGWYFVEQYYTTLSKSPERIHLFYSKKSQLVNGKEAEKVVPCVGQKAISDKIKELEFKDCKVRVLNVDSQASYQNIVVQVIGEMSNNAQPHNKFAQTFVLAEQPNGYFVLNDIFRYIDVGEEEISQEEVSGDTATGQTQTVNEKKLDAEMTGDSVVDEAGAQQLDKKLEEITLEDHAPSALGANGPVEQETEIAGVSEADTRLDLLPTQPGLPITEDPPEPEPSRSGSPPKDDGAIANSQATPVKKTWASMVGSKTSATALSLGQTTSPQVAASKSTPTATSGSTSITATAPEVGSAAQGNGWQTADHSRKPKVGSAKSDQVVLAYVKGVTDKVDARVLRTALESYGELKYFDVSRPKNCAFVEFASPEGYSAAAAANPHNVNGEQVLVEERRPRTGQFGNPAPGQYTRGGAPANRGRPSFQGRSGSQSGSAPKDAKDAPRGGIQTRGGTRGNVTPKGRGQAQPA